MGKKHNLGSLSGLASGILWGVDTVFIGLILSHSPFKESVVLAPFVSTFIHDFFSGLWLALYNAFHGGFTAIPKFLKSKSGLFVVIASLLGGPIGMTCYMLAIQQMGASNTAIVSSMYPAVGAFLGHFILKEKMKVRGFFGLALAIVATIILGLSTPDVPKNLGLGMLFAIFTVLGWAAESVTVAYGLKSDITPGLVLQIRQGVSAITYGLLILPVVKGYPLVATVFQGKTWFYFLLIALAGGASYFLYYQAIDEVGAIKAMGLNISYSGWAIFIGLFLGNPFSLRDIFLALLVITGSILTTDHPTELFKNTKTLKEN